ncbi:MAG TPA: hypothetical protein VFT45_08870 [Longimicrobium sp.]|nr:hypothetical protein [Longimicrobium sp.]
MRVTGGEDLLAGEAGPGSSGALPGDARRIHPLLPIFRLGDGAGAILYTPGHAVRLSRERADALEAAFAGRSTAEGGGTARLAERLLGLAAAAAARYRALAERPFEPECLTLYLGNECNLRCAYCYSTDRTGEARARALPVLGRPAAASRGARWTVLEPRVVAAAAAFVARACAAKRMRMTVVVHGGGEPTVHWTRLREVVGLTRTAAARHGVGWWGYIATNGVFGSAKARWLGQEFDLRGLSCDGPPDIQDRQRPGARRPTSAAVEETSRAWRAMGAAFTVRATITPGSVRRQPEICAYAAGRLGAREVVFEPVYRPGSARQEIFRPEDAEEFAAYFLAAERTAQTLGCRLTISGVRLDEIHGPYCNVLRDVLQVTPDGVGTACFLCTGEGEGEQALAIGRMEPGGRFALDAERIGELRRAAARIPGRCQSCVNVLHCARECPDVCPALGRDADEGAPGGFRCRVQRLLGEAWIRRAAGTADPRVALAE